jgi:hypothetical protein
MYHIKTFFLFHLILFHMPNKFYTHAKIRLYSDSWEHNCTHQQDSTSYNVFHISIDINVSCHSFIQPTNQGSGAEKCSNTSRSLIGFYEINQCTNVIRYLNKMGHNTEECIFTIIAVSDQQIGTEQMIRQISLDQSNYAHNMD